MLVVEAAHVSGSLITAHWAVDLGRPVSCVPGRVDHPASRGTLRLMREGATPVGGPEEWLADVYGLVATSRSTAPGIARPPRQQALLAALEGETLSADELARRVGFEAPRTLGLLSELELAGLVARAPGGLYRLTTQSRRTQ